jgi:hypothetical protein
LVVRKGSKIFEISSAGMLAPVSATRRRIQRAPSAGPVSTRICPPFISHPDIEVATIRSRSLLAGVREG